MTIPPLDTEAAALALPQVRAIYDAFRDGRATLTAGTAAMLSDALVSAGVPSGAYDSRILMHLADILEPHVAAVVAGWVERARHDEAVKLLEDALFLSANGERPPGAPLDDPEAETWRKWDREAETFLRRARGMMGP